MKQELDTLWQAKDAFMGTLGVPCSGCRYCCDTCPAGLNIPLLIQGYNEQRVSGEGWRLSNLKWTKGPEEMSPIATPAGSIALSVLTFPKSWHSMQRCVPLYNIVLTAAPSPAPASSCERRRDVWR